jgi:ATP-dependent DNA helicase RecG
MPIPTNDEIVGLLNQLDDFTADELENQWFEFKPWDDPKESRRVATECTVCFANAEGGVVVFGVADQVKGKCKAIQGATNYDLDRWKKDIYQSVTPRIDLDVIEIAAPGSSLKVLAVRVQKGSAALYGTTDGLYKKRVGKNCLPVDPDSFSKHRVSTGAIDWSGQPAVGIAIENLDPVEIGRARSVLQSKNPGSELLKLDNERFLEGLEAVRNGHVTNAGLILFGRPETIERQCPQSQLHYVHQQSETKVTRNDFMRTSLLRALEQVEQVFTGPSNPEEELTIGLFKLRIPAFSLDVVREAVLNAVTHRDYSDPGEILIRHTPRELVVTSPGGFVGGITIDNILRHEAVARNRTLANAFVKLRLVESAGTGRRRIFVPTLSFGKRMPRYESDGAHVTLRIFDGSYDRHMALLVARWRREGKEVGLDALLVLDYLKQNAFIDSKSASRLLQFELDNAHAVLDQLANPRTGILERRGRTKAATYHLAKGVAKDLLGKAAYTKIKGLNPVRYAEMVRLYLQDHGSISPKECRELLGLGNSPSARVEISRYLKKWSGKGGFLRMQGSPPRNLYVLAG